MQLVANMSTVTTGKRKGLIDNKSITNDLVFAQLRRLSCISNQLHTKDKRASTLIAISILILFILPQLKRVGRRQGTPHDNSFYKSDDAQYVYNGEFKLQPI